MRKIVFPVLTLVLLIFYWNCKSDTSHTDAPASGESHTSVVSENDLLEELKARAVDENDIQGRLQPTATVMQEEFSRSEALMPTIEAVSVGIDANCMLTISNRANGGEVIRVDLRALDDKRLRLIPDLTEGSFPGLQIATIDDQPVVQVLKNGSVVDTRSELVIYLADRPAIERITPYIVQALHICKGVQYPD